MKLCQLQLINYRMYTLYPFFTYQKYRNIFLINSNEHTLPPKLPTITKQRVRKILRPASLLIYHEIFKTYYIIFNVSYNKSQLILEYIYVCSILLGKNMKLHFFVCYRHCTQHMKLFYFQIITM